MKIHLVILQVRRALSHEEKNNKVNDIVNIRRHIRTADKIVWKSDEIFTNMIVRITGHFRGAFLVS